MPAYPCSRCATQVDIRDVTCRSCGEKKPFKCSRCDASMGALEVFNAEQVTFQKPLFCTRCGRDQERVPCHHCRNDVVRRDAVERVTPAGDTMLYHPDCSKTVDLQVKVSRGLMFVLIPLGAYLGYSPYVAAHVSSVVAWLGVPAGGLLGWFISTLLGPRK